MPYIGRDLNRGNYLKLDDISSSFNSSTKTFNLTVGGSAFTPGSAFSILVSVGGVIQEPESAYQVNNSEITFANAPTAQDSFFCIALAVPLGIGVPGNSTVNGTQMAKPFNYDGYFYLDDTNNRVGINSSSPTVALDVIGDINLNGNLLTGIGGTLGGTLFGNVYSTSGISTFNDLLVNGNLTVEGDTTTLNTTLRNVELLRVSAASTLPAGIITQTGTGDILNLYDGSNKEFSVADGGTVKVSQSMAFQQSDRTTTAGLLGRGSLLLAGTQQTDFAIRSNPHNSNLVLGVGVTERFRIDSSGRVGIGTNNPDGVLHISSGTANSDCVLIIESDTDDNDESSNPQIWFKQDGDKNVGFVGQDSNTLVISNNVSSSGGIIFKTGTTNNTGTTDPLTGTTEKLRIFSSGNLGVGDYTSTSLSHAIQALRTSGTTTISTKNTGGNATFYAEASNGNTAKLELFEAGTGGYSIEVGDDNAMMFKDDGVEKLRIDSGGRVMIGGTSNSASSHADELQIINTSAQGGLSIINASNGQGNIYFGHSGGTADGRIEYSHQADYMRFFTANDEWLRIISDGKVGIGTNNPQTALEIGSEHTDPVIRLNDSAGRRMSIRGPSVNNLASVGTETTHDLIFFTSGYSNERLRITNTGLVGINTTGANNGPAAPLHIYGNSDTEPILAFTRSTTHDDWQGAGIGLVDEGGSYKGALTFYTHGTSGSKNGAIEERLRINSSGRVGINTTTDSMDGVTGNLNIANTNFNNHTVINLSRNTAADRAYIRFSNTNGNIASIGCFASDFVIYAANDLILGPSNTEKVRIESDGDVIFKYDDSDTAPQVGATQVPHGLRIYNTNNTSGRLSGLHFSHGLAGTANAGIFHVTTNTASTSTSCLGDLTFWTKATGSSYMSERLRIDSSGRVGIGITNPKGKLDIDASGIDAAGDFDDPNDYAIVIRNSSTSNQGNGIAFTNDGGQHVGGAIIHIDKGSNNLGDLAFYTAATSSTPEERLRIDKNGRVLIGHTVTDDRDGYNSSLQVTGTSGDSASVTIGRWSDNQSSPALVFSKSRATTIGNHSVLTGNEYLGAIQFHGDDGTNYHVGASIQARVEAEGGGNDDMPTRLIFNTNRDEANVTNRMIIHGRGNDYGVKYGGRVDILGYEGQNITGGSRTNVLNEQLLICPSAADGYGDSHTITFGQTKGNWESGTSSAYDTSYGLMWFYGGQYNSTRELRAGIHYDHKGQERFKFWSSYGDIIFKTRSTSQGDWTAEECDQEPLRITDTNRVGINRGGTSSVDYTLDVDGQSVFRNWIRFGSGGTIKSTAFSGSSVYDTGVSVNAHGYGAGMIFIASQNYNAGTGTRAGVYFIKFYYDGDNAAVPYHIAGDNWVTFSKTASNTLGVAFGAGNNMFSYIGSSLNV